MSAAELRAWEALRDLRAEGIHVVRQHKIGRYTVDFAVRKARLAIEIDGGVHDLPGRAEYDAARQSHLENLGWRFIRIRAERVHDTQALLDAVRSATPSPSRGGGRGRGEPPQFQNETSVAPETTNIGASPHPLTPSSQEEGERLAFPKHLQRRTRANRKLPSRRKA
ncbi:MAG: endonuclease domain-containing protein [Alphaproteobacteria bacterium]